MTTQISPFSLSLSPAELSWLAGALGRTRLALPLSIPLLSDASLRQAQESLSARNLIQRTSPSGWQMDRLVLFLVQWLCTAKKYFRLEIQSRSKEPIRMILFIHEYLYLLVQSGSGQVNCLFLPEKEELENEIFNRCRLGVMQAGAGEYLLPEPDALIRIAWENADALPRALEISGLSEEGGKSTRAWLGTLERLITLQPVSSDQQTKPGATLWWCGTQDKLWAAKLDQAETGPVHFLPCSSKEAGAQLLATI